MKWIPFTGQMINASGFQRHKINDVGKKRENATLWDDF